jgi:DNA-binding PadR family transcriptional regulator
MADPPVSRATADVLTLLLQAWQDGAELTGWEIMRRTRRSGPTVYTVLDRLEDAGWVGASWEPVPPHERRARRRYYRLTATGAETASSQLAHAPPAGPRRLRTQPGFGRLAAPRSAG